MTQFKIGDSVIMTADSGKGDAFYEDNTYKGVVVEHGGKIVPNKDCICVKTNASNGFECFNPDGSHPDLPGLSIRPAKNEETVLPEWVKKMIERGEKMPSERCELIPTPSQWIEGSPTKPGYYWLKWNHEDRALPTWIASISHGAIVSDWWMPLKCPPPPPVEEKNPPSCLRCNQAAHDIDEYPCTPSQWIEGYIPESLKREENIFFVVSKTGKVGRVIFNNKSGLRAIDFEKWEDYSHYMVMPAELPPPPPVKEVEAYGMLVAVQKIKNKIGKSITLEQVLIEIDKAEDFYSQPATAEVLGECFEGICVGLHCKVTIDEYIAYAKVSGSKLIFTPAALDMLGVK